MKVPIRIYNHVSGRLLFQFRLIEVTGMFRFAANQPPRWYDLLTGPAEYGGKLEGKIEEGPRDMSKCTRLELSPACFHLANMFRKHHGHPPHHHRRGEPLRAPSAI
jgi:hypothetical protein